MWDLWAIVEAWLIAEAAWLAPLGTVLTGLGVFLSIRKPKPKSKKLVPSDVTLNDSSDAPKPETTLTVPEFIRLRRELKSDLEQELTEASKEEKTQLRARIAGLESREVGVQLTRELRLLLTLTLPLLQRVQHVLAHAHGVGLRVVQPHPRQPEGQRLQPVERSAREVLSVPAPAQWICNT